MSMVNGQITVPYMCLSTMLKFEIPSGNGTIPTEGDANPSEDTAFEDDPVNPSEPSNESTDSEDTSGPTENSGTEEWDDSDGDGIPDVVEEELGTDPNESDTDGNGLDDLKELENGNDATNDDTDRDGVQDGADTDKNRNNNSDWLIFEGNYNGYFELWSYNGNRLPDSKCHCHR